MKHKTGILISSESSEHPSDGAGVGLFTTIAGFRIATLPVVNQDDGQERAQKNKTAAFSQQANLKQWENFLSVLHSMALKDTAARVSYSIQFTATPRQNFGAKVSIHFFVRTSASHAGVAKGRAMELAQSVTKVFPKGDLRMAVITPTPLDEEELAEALLHKEDEIQLVTLSKFVEQPSNPFGTAFSDLIVQIPHPFLSDGVSPLVRLIDVLEQSSEKVCVRCEIEPTCLTGDEEEMVSLLSHLFKRSLVEGERQYEIVSEGASRVQAQRGVDGRAVKDWTETLRQGVVGRAAQLSPSRIKAAARGHYVYQRLYEAQSRLFTMSITLACVGASPVPDSMMATVLAALCANDHQDAAFGWKSPVLIKPLEGQAHEAVQSFRWMSAPGWQPNPELLRWRSFVTTREALTNFHLPALNGSTVGVETTSAPFYITAEFLRSIDESRHQSDYVTLGYAYNSNIFHEPQTVGAERALPYRVSLQALKNPMLVSGSPGGGKTNWLFCLLVDLWKEHEVPWCVIDPSGGQEYRYLLAEESLKEHLVVYTLGDNLTSPLRFNPFTLPPSGRGGTNTVRSHVARLLSCFKAASDMWTPLPEIFQEAICRAYANFEWTMDDTYETGKIRGLRFPSFTDFARALDEELEENVIPNYGRGTEAAGVLLGGTRDRVNSIVNQLGHILNVGDDSTEFFQHLLRTPCALELGSLGSEDTIALVMSFLLVQIAGHTEYASRASLSNNKQRLLFVEEAHILLSGEGSSKSNSMQQGNPRGKAAEDFGRLLLEFRKFGTGVVLIDQRIASLIGSAIDSSYLNLMFRTVAPASFEHLKTILSLDARQIEYAHTQLDEGRCILTDRASGRPVLIRQKNSLDELKARQLTFDEFVQRTQLNARAAGLITPQLPKRKDGWPAPGITKRVFQPRSS
ncbi:MAG TPA: hypothetical protein VF553_14505 [Pyrinomonadaceae bacterium]|jgi:hypothetical protein